VKFVCICSISSNPATNLLYCSFLVCVYISVLYATSITVALAPGDVTSYVEFLKNLNLSSAMIWFPVKATCAFPLVYHYINGIRHLVCTSDTSSKLNSVELLITRNNSYE